MTKKKLTSKFKTKVLLEALKERMTNQELAIKFDNHLKIVMLPVIIFPS